MMILTNGLTDVVDEGFLKVANNLVKRLKNNREDIEVVSYERQSKISDTFIRTNLFMSNKCVRDACKRHDDVLYIPFPTKKWVMALRVYLLSKFSKKLRVILVLKTPIGLLGKLFLKWSNAEIIVFSRDAADFYSNIVGSRSVTYLKTGVDTQKFTPVSKEQSILLKKKYGFDPKRKIILHVGHLNEGRNIRVLTKISDNYQVLLVTSTFTKGELDIALKKDLLLRSNIKIIEDYIPNIQEIYQLSDAYFFPVVESGHCIDTPLSCLEAAACGKPVITTTYGEMSQRVGKKGFYLINDFGDITINNVISQAIDSEHCSTIEVLDYDWNNAISYFTQI